VQRWIWTFNDMASLDAQLDEAKIPTGSLRDIAEFATTEWATQWGATRTVPDGAGARITVPGQPWHFTNAAKPNDSTDATETTDTGANPIGSRPVRASTTKRCCTNSATATRRSPTSPTAGW
jgi:crotonobetainyl-CoA:carnitine CoA-transferase CaiB-like acyl-CoA transferase